RLTPKVTAATTPATATKVPSSAVRDASPRPRSNDMPTPAVAAGPRREPATALVRRPGRRLTSSVAFLVSVPAVRHAGIAALAIVTRTTATKPRTSTATLIDTPGWISA